MRRVLSAVLGAVDAFAIVAMGLGTLVLLATVSWLAEFGFAGSFVDVWRFAVNVWLLGHGVDLLVTLDPVLLAQLGVAELAAFPFTLAISGIGLLTVTGGWRSGRRIAMADAPLTAGVGSIIVLAAVSAGLAFTAMSPAASATLWQAAVFPAALFAVGNLIGLVGTPPGKRMWDWLGSAVPGWSGARVTTKSAIRSAWRNALGIWVASIGIGGALVSLMLVLQYGSVIALYQTLQAGVWGGIVLTLGQLLLIPTLAVWAASWMFGAGFSIGVGTSVSPVATLVGGVPGVPVLGAIPLQSGQWGLLILLVPLLLSFTVAALTRRNADRFTAPASTTALLGTAVASALFTSALLAGSAWLASGAIGPGALSEVGPQPLTLALWSFVVVLVGSFLGGIAGRTLRA